MITQNRQRQAERESPQFQVALQNLINLKQQALREQTFQQRLIQAKTPEELSMIYAQAGDPSLVAQQQEQQYKTRERVAEQEYRTGREEDVQKHEIEMRKIPIKYDYGSTSGTEEGGATLSELLRTIEGVEGLTQGQTNILKSSILKKAGVPSTIPFENYSDSEIDETLKVLDALATRGNKGAEETLQNIVRLGVI